MTQISKLADKLVSNQLLKSNTVEIISEKQLIGDKNQQMKCFDKDDKQLPDMNLFNLLPISQKNIFFDRSVSARAEYIPVESGSEYKNRVKISINIAYRDGMIPLISTVPLHNCRIALTDQQYTKAHLCSNFIDNSLNFKQSVKYGFVSNNIFDDKNQSSLSSLMLKYRDSKTQKLYSNLDLNECEWKFTSYYDLNELVNLCEAKIIYESETRESEKNFITLKIPLYISYLQANSPSGWNCVEHKTEIETSLQYLTYSYDDNGEESNSDIDISLMSLSVSKLKVDRDGRLVMELSTIPYFNGKYLILNRLYRCSHYIVFNNTGYFVKSHLMLQNHKSRVIAPNGKEYDLELKWDQNSDNNSEQIWRIKSTGVLQV
jgi:hypothetical protein